jgi:hypothetical protein
LATGSEDGVERVDVGVHGGSERGICCLVFGGVAEQVVPPERVKLDYLLDMGLVNVEKSSRLPWSTIPAGCRPLRQAPWFVQVALCRCRPENKRRNSQQYAQNILSQSIGAVAFGKLQRDCEVATPISNFFTRLVR